jgi:RNA polymerase sigma factor (TIGR02999 family)
MMNHRVAANKMAHEAPGHILQPTALVHEAWLRLVGQDPAGRIAPISSALLPKRCGILIDNARRKRAVRHGGGQHRLNLEEMELAAAAEDDQLIAVREALEKFEAQDKVKAELVKLRYFAGMTIEEAAKVLGVSEPTVKRYWNYARAWLYREIRESEKTP